MMKLLPGLTRKNAMALHVIQISCEPRVYFVIRRISSAKIAWDTLKAICKIDKSDYDVPEEEESYAAWSDRMKTILMRHDLWNIVETTTEPTTRVWSKKNAMALYLIRESCGLGRFSLIEKIKYAKSAWDVFAKMSESDTGPVIADPNSGMRNDENSGFSQYLSFEKHIRKGNWDAAMQFINSHPEAVSARISFLESTALHIAIFEGHTNIVEELVKIMSEENLKIKDTSGFTVLGHCAMAGNIQMAKCIIGKSRSLLSIGNGIDDLIPVVLAIACNHSGAEMARYLYSETPLEDLMPRNGINGATFITWAIYSKAIDMALNLLDSYPELAITLDCYGQSPVQVLAGMSFAYRSGNQLVCWKQWIYNKIDQIYELKLLHHQSKKLLLRMCEVLPGLNYQQLENGKVFEAMIKAVKQGKVEFVTEMLKACPNLVFCYEKSTERDLFKLAVLYRQGEVLSLLCRYPAKNPKFASVDRDKNTILHIAAMFEPSARRNTVPGAAFLMQREVQWYKV
ncbi:uncharacterized protein LOC136062722 isoform X2 [Quercus suber]|uniref:uncharacterized protein LOC136062722 isoform X2 n=1 Tax=Quercus suber TaxID=58331 RepID=UPI0032DFB769